MRKKGVDASYGLLRIQGINLVLGLGVFFWNGQDARSSDGFEGDAWLRMDHPDTNEKIIAGIENGENQCGSNYDSFCKGSRRNHVNFGGADGIRIHQRYGNKGVLRCSPAF